MTVKNLQIQFVTYYCVCTHVIHATVVHRFVTCMALHMWYGFKLYLEVFC